MENARRKIVVMLLALLALCVGKTLAASPSPAVDSKGLRIINTRHYEIHTDLDPEFATDLAQRMDVMYEVYEQRLADFALPKNAPNLPAYLFTHQADYMTLTEHRATNTGGIFWVGDKTFLASFLEGQGRDAMRRTLQHEAFHQFAYFAISQNLPIWLNEGLAQVFEEGIWTGRDFLLGQVPPMRVRQLNDDIKHRRLVAFQTFLAITPDQWTDTITSDAEKGGTYYNQAWAMVHFLAESGRADYHQRFIKYLHLLHHGDDSTAAFNASFSNNIQGFQDRFAEWAAKLQSTNEATLIERQDTLADFLEALAQKHKTFTDMTTFRAAITGNGYKLQYTRGHIQWTTQEASQIYFSNIAGRIFSPRELYFQRSSSSSLPDIICRASDQVQLRTHFYAGIKKLEHEVKIEPVGR